MTPAARRALLAAYFVAVALSVAAFVRLSPGFWMHALLIASGVAWIVASPRLGRLLASASLRARAAAFFAGGLAQAALIGENLAILMRGDLHANLAINTLLWLGSYAGWLRMSRDSTLGPARGGAVLAAIMLPLAGFAIGSLWIVLWRALLEL